MMTRGLHDAIDAVKPLVRELISFFTSLERTATGDLRAEIGDASPCNDPVPSPSPTTTRCRSDHRGVCAPFRGPLAVVWHEKASRHFRNPPQFRRTHPGLWVHLWHGKGTGE